MVSQGFDFTISALKVITDALSPAAKVVIPAVTKAGEEAIKIASPVISDASNQAKEALQGAGIDPNSVISAIKVHDSLSRFPDFKIR